MAGVIWTDQKCPACGKKFPTSKGGFPIICDTCKTQPTKFIIKIPFQKKRLSISRDRDGRTVHNFYHAVNLLGQIRSEIQAGIFDPQIYKKQSNTKFDRFWDNFLDNYKDRPATHDKINAIGIHHLSELKQYQMRDIRAYHIDEWWKALKKKKLSPHYLNDIHSWVHAFFSEALRLDIVEKVPNFPDRENEPEKDIEWLNEGEQDIVMEYIPNHDQPIFDFLFLTGCRVNEAVALQRSDVDFNKGRTIINHTVKRNGSIGPTKNKKPRIIPHFPELEECVKAAMKFSGLHFVFVNKWGRRYSDDYLRDTFKKACINADMKPIRLKNATRHSFGMNLIGEGEDIWTVSKAMGHSDIKMTQKYVDLVAEQTRHLYGRRKCVDDKKRKVVNIGKYK